MRAPITLSLLGQERRITGGPFDAWSGDGIALCLDPTATQRPRATIDLPLADYSAPTAQQFSETLAATLAALQASPGAPLYIGCRAGIGRTGTFIAGLAGLANHADPIAWTRRHYHPGAVETPAQEQAVAALDPGAVWSAYRGRTNTTPRPYALHYYPDNASTYIHFLLRELGLPHELRLVDRKATAQRSPDYLRLNPKGLIPVLIDPNLDDLVVTETVAIALHLLDRHPEAALAPAIGTAERARFYEWMMYLTNTIQPEHLKRAYPDRHVSDPAAVPDVRATAIARLDRMFDHVEAALAAGPYLLGPRYSAADPFLFMLTMWAARMPRRPASLPNLAAHSARLLARPAIQAVLAAEGLSQPFV